ncbi:MAG TPA: sugar ABC transporter permease [Chloroflexia bacterium]|nr:sugar ABC transporter permease [Chloroflexia bacterium]
MKLLSRPQSAAVASVGAQSVGKRRDLQKLTVILTFLVPPGMIYFGLVLWPVIQAVRFSLFDWNGLGPMQDFIGIGNYLEVLHDNVFMRALGNNLLLAALSVLVQLPLAFALALLIRRNLAGRTVFRVIFFLPYVLSEVITGVLWLFIYNPQVGLLNKVLSVIPGFEAQGWLGDTNMVFYALFVVITWKYFGLHLILYTAGLQNVPAELEEAAVIDGASATQVIRYVTIPMLGPTLRLSLFLSVLGSLQIFDLIWVMTTGGPVNASQTMATYIYKFGFKNFAIGYGSAVAVVLFTICFVFSFLYQRYVMKRDYQIQ